MSIPEWKILAAKEENIYRLAQYLGIDITGLSKDEAAHVIAINLMFQNTLKNFEW